MVPDILPGLRKTNRATRANPTIPTATGSAMTTFEYEARCPLCGKTTTLTLNRGAFNHWRNGRNIQKAFPELTTDQRELLQTGIDSDCWNQMFPEENQ